MPTHEIAVQTQLLEELGAHDLRWYQYGDLSRMYGEARCLLCREGFRVKVIEPWVIPQWAIDVIEDHFMEIPCKAKEGK